MVCALLVNILWN